MFKKTLTFVNFKDEDVQKDFYFHLSKAELLAMAANGDEFEKRIKRITDAQDGNAIINEVRALIGMSVGVRSEDGERFVKDELAQSYLLDSPAFDVLIMELATSATAMTEFVQQLIPEKMQKEMTEQIAKAKAKNESDVPDPLKAPEEDSRPKYQQEHRHPTPAEFQVMSKTEMGEAMGWVQKNRP